MTDAPPTRPTPSRTVLWLMVAPLILLVIAANLGDAFMPYLVDNNPLLLIALNARNRNLALVTNQLDAFSYYTVGFIRLVLSDPLFYLLGWFYGDAAVKWVERNTQTLGDSLRWVERNFKNFALPLVFAIPNNFICLFAGAAGMRPAVFALANVSGTIVRLYIIRALGETFSGPLDWLVDFIAEYRLPLLGLSIALVIFTFFNERKRGGGELTGLTQLADDLEADSGAAGAGSAHPGSAHPGSAHPGDATEAGPAEQPDD